MAPRSSRKNTRWFSGSQYTRDGGNSRVYSGVPGRKLLGLLMTYFLTQNPCRHWDLGRIKGVCGEEGG